MNSERPAPQGMTGFARAVAKADGAELTWELRSVNGQIEYLLQDAARRAGRNVKEARRAPPDDEP